MKQDFWKCNELNYSYKTFNLLDDEIERETQSKKIERETICNHSLAIR